MTKSISIGTRITPELDADLSKVAAILARPKSWLVEQALKEYLIHEKSFLRSIAEGIEEADRGDLVYHAQVVKRMNNKIKR